MYKCQCLALCMLISLQTYGQPRQEDLGWILHRQIHLYLLHDLSKSEKHVNHSIVSSACVFFDRYLPPRNPPRPPPLPPRSPNPPLPIFNNVVYRKVWRLGKNTTEKNWKYFFSPLTHWLLLAAHWLALLLQVINPRQLGGACLLGQASTSSLCTVTRKVVSI